MTSHLKAFRLVNDREISLIERTFAQRLAQWNEEQALFPLSCHLSRSPAKPLPANSERRFVGEYALMTGNDLSVIKHSLFGDVSASFDEIAHIRLITFLDHLLDVSSSGHAAASDSSQEWFYTGSPSLTLHLHAATYTMALHLHPYWVLDTLPRIDKKPALQGTIQKALGTERLLCQIELTAISLPLEALVQLKVGDVIRSDHAITTPLILKHQHKTICHVRLGTDNHKKSIQIESTL